MPRRPNIERPAQLCLRLPETVKARLDLFLMSEAEGRIPKGAYQRFFLDRINEFFSKIEVQNEHPES